MRLHTPIESDDLPLDESVRRQVRRQTAGMIHELQVHLMPGQVILTGQASSYYAKQLATHAAMNVIDEGLELMNDIEVS